MIKCILQIIFGIVLSIRIVSCEEINQFPILTSNEGNGGVFINENGVFSTETLFDLEKFQGDMNNKVVDMIRMLVIYQGGKGFDSNRSLGDGATKGSQLIRWAMGNNKEPITLIEYRRKNGELDIDKHTYKLTEGNTFIIDLRKYPAIRVIQKGDPPKDKISDPSALLKYFQNLFVVEDLIRNAKLVKDLKADAGKDCPKK